MLNKRKIDDSIIIHKQCLINTLLTQYLWFYLNAEKMGDLFELRTAFSLLREQYLHFI